VLDIWVDTDGGRLPTEPCLTLCDSGYYWFLYPLFVKLQAGTGQMIDLYGDATFSGPDLDALERTLTEAQRLVEAQPESWPVHVGTRASPAPRVIYQSVDQTEFLRLLGVWGRAVARAKHVGGSIVGIGD